MINTLSDTVEYPRFKGYLLPSDDGQPIETAFEKGVRCFLAYEEELKEWAVLQIHEDLGEAWRHFFEGQASALERNAALSALLPMDDVGVDDGMVYTIRPYLASESLASYTKRVGTLPWDVGAKLVRDLVKTLIRLRNEDTLFRRLDLSSVRVSKDADGELVLTVVGCSRETEVVKTERDRVQELCAILTQLVDMGEAPDCVDRLIDLAYGLDEGNSPQNLDALLETLPMGFGGFKWLKRRAGVQKEWAPRCPFQHPDLAAFREQFGLQEDRTARGGLSEPLAVMPFSATSICLFAVGITTSRWG